MNFDSLASFYPVFESREYQLNDTDDYENNSYGKQDQAEKR